MSLSFVCPPPYNWRFFKGLMLCTAALLLSGCFNHYREVDFTATSTTPPAPVVVPDLQASLTLHRPSLTLYGAQYQGDAVTFFTDGNGAPASLVFAQVTTNATTYSTVVLGARASTVTGIFRSYGHSGSAVATLYANSIISAPDRDRSGFGNDGETTLYTTPPDLYLVTAGGFTTSVQADAGKTLAYTHLFYRNEIAGNSSTATIYTHYLGAEYAAFAVVYESGIRARQSIFHGGVRTPASYFSTVSLATVVYHILPGAAIARFQAWRNATYYSNLNAGSLVVDVANDSALLNVAVTLRGTRTNSGGVIFTGWELSLAADKRTFSNANCPVNTGGAALASGCRGTVAWHFTATRVVGTNNMAPAYFRNQPIVHGAFYGSQAQEFALASSLHIRNSDGDTLIHFLALGRRANPVTTSMTVGTGGGGGGAGASASPANALATFADGSWGVHGGAALARAEHAAFSAVRGEGGVVRIAHQGTRTPAAAVAAREDTATYRISVGGAGGVYSAAGSGAVSLANTAPGALHVDFAQDTAHLNLQVGDSNGSTYALNNIGLNLHTESNALQFCANCGGSVTGSGALARFNRSDGLQIHGAFYGGSAQNAAAALHHVHGNAKVDIGFVATE